MSMCLTFSPLFIGEVSSTLLSAESPRHEEQQPFSPLFIGEVSSTWTGTAFGTITRTFSPLFIGEVSSTPTLRRQ